MREFALIFRSKTDAHANPTPEQMEDRMNWLGGIAAQKKLVDKGNRLSANSAKTVKPGNIVTDGPYAETEFVSGYMVVKTATIEEAIELAKDNPILKIGGSVEVRAVLTLNDKS